MFKFLQRGFVNLRIFKAEPIINPQDTVDYSLRYLHIKDRAHRSTRQAVDFLRDHPEKFNFTVTLVPESTDDFGCWVGWAAYFAGERGTRRIGNRAGATSAGRRLGLNWHEILHCHAGLFEQTWRTNPAAVLKSYADSLWGRI